MRASGFIQVLILVFDHRRKKRLDKQNSKTESSLNPFGEDSDDDEIADSEVGGRAQSARMRPGGGSTKEALVEADLPEWLTELPDDLEVRKRIDRVSH